MTNPPTPPPPDLGTPKPPPPDLDSPTPPPLGSDTSQTNPPILPDPGTGKHQGPALPAADTYKFGDQKHFDLAMSEIDGLHESLRAAREFALFVMTKDRTWPEVEAEVRLIHEECHWHLEHDHGIVI
ncbi:MAG: hypothetical protein AAB624_01060 [Patescibacteria group bacterium]